jgi:hypothetical protein
MRTPWSLGELGVRDGDALPSTQARSFALKQSGKVGERRRHGKTHSEAPDDGDIQELLQEDRLVMELVHGCMQGAEEGGG